MHIVVELACLSLSYALSGMSQILDIGYKENHYWDNVKLLLMVNIVILLLSAILSWFSILPKNG
jgi:hypothetical protein